MTMGIGPVLPPSGSGPGVTGPAEEMRNQEEAQTARQTGQTAAVVNGAADQPTTTLETAQAVQPTPATSAAVKVELDTDQIAKGIVEYPITGPDLFAHAATEQAIQVADEAREIAETVFADVEPVREMTLELDPETRPEPPAAVAAPHLQNQNSPDATASRAAEPARPFVDAPTEPAAVAEPAAEAAPERTERSDAEAA